VPLCLSPIIILAWIVRRSTKQAEQKLLAEIEVLIQNLGDPKICKEAAAELHEIGQPAVEPLLKAYRPMIGEDELLAISVLASIGDSRAIDDLIDNLESGVQERDVRLALVKALSKFDDDRIIPAMIKVQNDRSKYVREAAEDVLEKFDPKKVKKAQEKYMEQQILAEQQEIEAQQRREEEKQLRVAQRKRRAEKITEEGRVQYLFVECEATEDTPGALKAVEKVTQDVYDKNKNRFAGNIQMKAFFGVTIPTPERVSVETFVRMRQIERGLPLSAFEFEFRKKDGFTVFVTYMKSE